LVGLPGAAHVGGEEGGPAAAASSRLFSYVDPARQARIS